MIRYVAFFAVVVATVYGNIYLNPQPTVLQRPPSRPVFDTQPVFDARSQPVFSIPAPQPAFPSPRQSFPAPQPAFPSPHQTFPAPQPAFPSPHQSFPAHQPALPSPRPTLPAFPAPRQTFPASLPSVSTTRNVPASNSRPSFTSPVLPSSQCDPIGKPLVDEIRNGRAYHFSWCHTYGQTYTWHDAIQYCSNLGNGFQAVSIEDASEDDFLSQIISTHQIPHVWTSGNKLHSYYWTWQSNVNTGYNNWSHTGRRGLPQPDNDEQNEDCVAILNNHYNDGIAWHDSRCDALKHVICEARQFYH